MTVYLKALTAGIGIVAVSAAVFSMTPGDSASDSQNINATQGMVAVIDKESGELRAPTAYEARNYQDPVQRNAKPMEVERRADGSESMKLDDSYTIYSTVERNADGSWSRQCSQNHDHAQHAQKAVK